MRALSLRLKLYMSVISLLLIMGAGLIITAQISVRDLGQYIEEETANDIRHIVSVDMEATAGLYGEKVAGKLQAALRVSQVVKSIIAHNMSQSEATRLSRSELKSTLEKIAIDSDAINALYASFEPDRYDGNDAFFAGKADHSSKTGELELYFYRDPDGDIQFGTTEDSSVKYDATLDEFGNRVAEWYLCAHDKKAACLLEPYDYEVKEGYNELMTSLVVPILDNGNFAGVVGTDVNLSTLKNMMHTISQSLFDGQSKVTLLSQRGHIVASSHYNDKVLRPLKEAIPDRTGFLTQLHTGDKHFSDDTTLYVAYKIDIGVPDTAWSLLIELPTDVALANVTAMSEGIQDAISTSAYEQSLLGGLILLLSLGVIILLVRSVVTPLDVINRRMHNLATTEGDLTVELAIDTHAELIELSNGFNLFLKRLRRMVDDLKDVGKHVNTQSIDVSKISKEAEAQTIQQRQAIESVVTAMNAMSASAAEVAHIASNASGNAVDANQNVLNTQATLRSAVDGVDALANDMSEASDAITRVAERSEEINCILDVIRGIADQTNLLALNAAIEAARAGEQGRGFAVVADEVRSLAFKTRESTDEITRMIDALKEGVVSAVDIIHAGKECASLAVKGSTQANEALSLVVEEIGDVVVSINQVATAANQQSEVSGEIDNSLTHISATSVDVQHLANKVRGSGKTLGKQVAILDSELGQLKT
ncbi:MAG: chemotaxis protein [Neptuniibacter caesariensis]|uniref:Chemotaxis protein n=1 Tax=Neptuniibacter caesariensis TaxID=207954 RepID=A0A2G6JBB7_NEPCE|nr:MAG: chemotaxis protein [Neptuniibacter caesariensis]